MNRREIAVKKISSYEKEYCGCKYVFINNDSSKTNVIFTGGGQKYYMLISWFNDNVDYNYLYLNCKTCDYTNIDIYKKIISMCNSKIYNMIGISYGAYSAIVYSDLFPTLSIIIVDPARIRWNVNLETIIMNSKAKFFYHRSLHPHDIQEFIQIRNALEKSSCFYTIKCSLTEVHSANIPNEGMIFEYIKFSESLENDSCSILMKNAKMSDLVLEFLPWT